MKRDEEDERRKAKELRNALADGAFRRLADLLDEGVAFRVQAKSKTPNHRLLEEMLSRMEQRLERLEAEPLARQILIRGFRKLVVDGRPQLRPPSAEVEQRAAAQEAQDLQRANEERAAAEREADNAKRQAELASLEQRIVNAIKQHGVDDPPDTHERAFLLLMRGHRVGDVAEMLGVSRDSIERWRGKVLQQAAAKRPRQRPRGKKDAEGNLEAWPADE